MKKKLLTAVLATACACSAGSMVGCGKDKERTWKDYFVFDNVAATSTTLQNAQGSTDTYITEETIAKEGDKWIWTRGVAPNDSSDIFINTDTAYYDGNKTTVEDKSDSIFGSEPLSKEEAYQIGSTWFNHLEMFAEVESSFTETASGVFEAEAITFTNTYEDVKIVVADKYLQSIEYTCTYIVDGDPITQEVEIQFYYWGEIDVDFLLQDIEGDQDPAAPAPDRSEFWEYFDFDNVTVVSTTVENFVGETTTYTKTETMKVAAGKWLWTSVSDYGASVSDTMIAYWDGTNITVEGTSLTNDAVYAVGEDWFSDIEGFAYAEDSFVETAEGVYEAETTAEIDPPYTDVKVVIVDGHIQSIEYNHTFDSQGSSITQVVSMTFSNWGTTVVEAPAANP